ncbi:MAG: ubiquitin-conjugating enzyme E2 [Candidatus Helarchaeota archaeon]
MDPQFEFILAREAQLMYRRAVDFQPVSGNLTRWRGFVLGRGPTKNMKFEVEIVLSPEYPRQPPKVLLITPTIHPQVDPSTGTLNLRILTYWRPEYHLYQVVNSLKGLFARIPPKLPDTFTSNLVPNSFSKPKHPSSTSSPAVSPPSNAIRPIPRPSPQRHSSPEPEKSLLPEESPHLRELKGQISNLESELSELQKSLMNKEEEVARLAGRMDAHNIPRQGAIEQVIVPKNPTEKSILDLQSEKIALEDLIRTLEDKFEFGEINSTEYAKLYKSYQKQLFLIKQKLKQIGIN